MGDELKKCSRCGCILESSDENTGTCFGCLLLGGLPDDEQAERTLQDTLVTAQALSDDLKKTAMKEAEVRVSEAELNFLRRELESEGVEDRDFYINRATLDWFETRHIEPHLITLLRNGIGQREEMDIEWFDPDDDLP